MSHELNTTDPGMPATRYASTPWWNGLAEIFWGDDRPEASTPPPRQSWIAAEEGMISFVTLVAVLFFLIMIGFLGNVGLIINQKIEVQNGADSIALSASQVHARAMNAVTASNHLIGELLALVVIHHAFGGDELDDGEKKDSPEDDETQTELELAYEVATTLGSGDTLPPLSAIPPFNVKTIYDDAMETPEAGATLFDSVMRLRRVLSWAFYAYGLGAALQKLKPIPIVGQILWGFGISISGAAATFIGKVYMERKILSVLESLVGSFPIKAAKKAAIAGIKGLYIYQRAVVIGTPLAVMKAKSEMADQAAVTGETYPGLLPPAMLPVEEEPDDLPSLSQSQLARSMWPWTNRWRSIIQDLMWQWLRLARSANYYDYYSLNYAHEWTEKFKKDESINLNVMKGLHGDESANGAKGEEKWTTADGSATADKLFCIVGLAHRSAPKLHSNGIYKRQNPDGVVAYAQGMIYNANPQIGGGGANQARVGWDTLNWISEVPEMPDPPDEVDPGAYLGLSWYEDAEPYPDKPMMFMNWRAKLVPETRLKEAGLLPGSIGTVVRRIIPVYRSFKTH